MGLQGKEKREKHLNADERDSGSMTSISLSIYPMMFKKRPVAPVIRIILFIF